MGLDERFALKESHVRFLIKNKVLIKSLLRAAPNTGIL
jgi:hypothetical protein